MVISLPLIDNRTREEILQQIQELARSYLPNKWIFASHATNTTARSKYSFDLNNQNQTIPNTAFSSFSKKDSELAMDDLGISLSKIFASLYFNVIERLNKLPQKNFISFLNTLAFGLSSPIPAMVPVTFNVTEKATDDVFVPAGTKVAAAPSDRYKKELIFETSENMLASKATLDQVISVDTKRDAIYSHIEDILSSENFNFFFDLKNGNIQEHIIYLGHDELFNFKKTLVKIEIDILTFVSAGEEKSNKASLIELLSDENNVAWEYGWELDNNGKEKKNSAFKLKLSENKDTKKINNAHNNENESENNKFVSSQTVILSNHNDGDIKENKKVKINGIEKFWIRCRVLTNDFTNTLSQLNIQEYLPISKINVNVQLDENQDGKNARSNDGSSNSKSKLGDKSTSDNNSKQESSGFINPDQLFYKDTPLKLSKPIYPFGKQPFTLDIFYIGSNVCFSKKNSQITLRFIKLKLDPPFNRTPDPNQPNSEPVLSWEYWNGKGWNLLNVDMGDNLNPEIVEMTFTCPNDITITKVNGFENYWIRVKISSGNYGNGEIVQTTTYDRSDPPRVIQTTTYWDYSKIPSPKFDDLKIKFEYPQSNINGNSDTIENVDLIKSVSPFCITFNNLEYRLHTDENNSIITPFKPFVKFNDMIIPSAIGLNVLNMPQNLKTDSPSCNVYLGFTNSLEKGPYHIYLSIIEKKEIPDYVKKGLNFYYYSEKGWKKLFVDDNTNYFTKRGTLKFFLPSDFKSLNLFGKSLFWIKMEDADNVFHSKLVLLPRLNGIHTNTVICVNSSLVENEILYKDESVSGSPKYVFLNKPVISSIDPNLIDKDDDDIWIREDQNISEKEKEVLLKNKRLIEVADSSGATVESWVKWTDISKMFADTSDNLLLYGSNTLTRNYSLDRINGTLTFGPIFESYLQNIPSNSKGMVGSIFQGNEDIDIGLVKATYRTGGGSFGNVQVGEIKKLKSLIPSIDSIINYFEGEGGF